jgi:hypothetical protein
MCETHGVNLDMLDKLRYNASLAVRTSSRCAYLVPQTLTYFVDRLQDGMQGCHVQNNEGTKKRRCICVVSCALSGSQELVDL